MHLSGLTKTHPGGVRAVAGRSMTAARGQVTAVLGPNGSGKTTTIECCEGLRTADSGTVRVLGLDPARERAALRARVGVMLQDGGLPAAARAGAVLDHVARMYAEPRSPGALSALLGLDAFERTPVRRLSGGQRQRLALATAVVGRPELVFLDEPSAGLDPQGRIAVWGLVSGLREHGVAVVLTTHLMEEAAALADEVVIVDRGRVIAYGSPTSLVAGPDTSGAVRFAGPPGLGAALTVAAGGSIEVTESSPGAYTATAPGAESEAGAARLIAALTAAAVERGVVLTGFATGRRTLEDVFLDLTGRELR